LGFWKRRIRIEVPATLVLRTLFHSFSSSLSHRCSCLFYFISNEY
jgi:hypothetical protein